MRGRKPELKVVEGGLKSTPRAPKWLPDEARDVWRQVVPGLIKRGVLTDGDLPSVQAYCLAWGDVLRLRKVIAEEGDVIQTKSGPKRHPAWQTLQQMMTESRRLAAELGLMPASRGKAERAPIGEALSEQEEFRFDFSPMGL